MKILHQKLPDLLSLNGLNLSSVQISLIENYVNNLIYFNRQVNLISRKDEEFIYERHIIPCLVFSKLFNAFEQSVLDIGTGGGLPGVIFSIYHRNSLSTLIDSVKKKIKIVNNIIQNIGLDNVHSIWTRAEDPLFIKQYKRSFHLIISRATSDLTTLIKYALPLAFDSTSKLAAMKGGDELDDEIELAKRHFNYIAIQKIPLIYLPENPNNKNNKFAVIVEKINEG